MLTNSEHGLSFNGGYFISKNGALETRISIAKTNQISFAPQIHFGYNFFLLNHFNVSEKKLYVGAFTKFWDFYNIEKDIHFFNIVPYVTVGYLWQIGNFNLDLRLNQTIAAVSWSTMEHTSTGAEFFFSPMRSFSPVLPYLSFNVEYRF